VGGASLRAGVVSVLGATVSAGLGVGFADKRLLAKASAKLAFLPLAQPAIRITLQVARRRITPEHLAPRELPACIFVSTFRMRSSASSLVSRCLRRVFRSSPRMRRWSSGVPNPKGRDGAAFHIFLRARNGHARHRARAPIQLERIPSSSNGYGSQSAVEQSGWLV
jgi:hypothetical protein